MFSDDLVTIPVDRPPEEGGAAAFGEGIEALELAFPVSLVEQPEDFDAFIGDVAEAIEHGDDPYFALDDHNIIDAAEREVLENTIGVLRKLRDEGRDHIWAYYTRNLVRPVTLALKKVDVIVGNPPWLKYSNTTYALRTELGPVHTIGLNMISLEDGTYRSSIRTNSSLSAGATRQREHVEPPSPQRNSVRRRAWLQVAGLASEVWLLAHSLYPHEPLVQKRSPQSGVRTPSTRADSAHQYRGGFGGQHDCQGASRWHGRVKKNGPQSIGKSRGGWTTKIHMVAADARTALMFSLSAGQAHDAPEGRKLLNRLGPQRENLSIVMDRAYEGNETRQLALALGFTPVVPPSSTRVSPWTYDMEMYKRRNEVERLFRRLKGFRRIFSLASRSWMCSS